MKSTSFTAIVVISAAVLLHTNNSLAAVYSGNGSTTGGGAVGTGSLSLTDNGTTVSGTFNRGIGAFRLNLVIYIDCVSGGFTDTTQFSDSADALRTAVSGYWSGGLPGPARATAYFANGFTADYAIALGVNSYRGDLYHLVPGGDGSMEYIRSVNLYPNKSETAASYTFSFNWADIGLTAGPSNFFRFQSSYIGIGGTAYRELESFESLTGTRGYETVTFGNYNTYGIDPVPEMTTGALAIFGGIFVTARLVAHARRRRPNANRAESK